MIDINRNYVNYILGRNFDDESEENTKLMNYLSSVMSSTIAEWIRNYLNPETPKAREWLGNLASNPITGMICDGWFGAINNAEPYLIQDHITVQDHVIDRIMTKESGTNGDTKTIKRFLTHKLIRFLEKASDAKYRSQYFRPDLFEEQFLRYFIAEAKSLERERSYSDKVSPREGETYTEKVKSILISVYNIKGNTAERLAKKVTQVPAFEEYRYEEDSIVFFDDDSRFFFEKGFVKALNMIAVVGLERGYDYDYFCNMFTDAGYKIPYAIIGTKEIHENRHENAQRAFFEELERLIGKQ